MTSDSDLGDLSGAELDELLDRLSDAGETASALFERAYAEWERRDA